MIHKPFNLKYTESLWSSFVILSNVLQMVYNNLASFVVLKANLASRYLFF